MDIRPVAPFVELWCDVGADGRPTSWERRPLTTRLLANDGLNIANLIFEATAMNFKVARRTRNNNHRFGTFQPVQRRGDDHRTAILRGMSPPVGGGASPMIPPGRSIPLGQIQVLRPRPQPAPGTTPWASEVNVETIRMRFTPAGGEIYGPAPFANFPLVTSITGQSFTALPEDNAFLDINAGWFAAPLDNVVVPADTFDGAESNPLDQQLATFGIRSTASFGIVDDTCEARVRVQLDRSPVNRPNLVCHTTIFSGPPDFAPDRRPFLSLADSFNDRAADKVNRSQRMTDDELDLWVEDLFERAFETVSLMNVDFWRGARAADLSPNERRPQPIATDNYPQSNRAMGALDALRDGNISLDRPNDNVPLPMTERAMERHRDLSDILALKRFVRENPTRLDDLIRRPFSIARNENGSATTMQMPPFMRHSNAQPLTLAVWQYDLLMEWRRRVLATSSDLDAGVAGRTMSPGAAARRSSVLRLLDQPEEL